ncbi:MAG: RNA pseudouridine synthase [Burkholderiaceae bacterium]|nr:RNA pseudouridine synthase [Burkholderiaceae bacterium]
MLEIIHADAHRVLVNKPSGLLSVPGRGEDKQDCASLRVQQLFPDALIVHRLDMATSGLLLFARGLEMQRRWSAAFATRAVLKRYVAIVSGCPVEEAWQIDLPLIADWPQRPRQKVDFEVGKPSITRVQVLATMPEQNCARLLLEPLTGRSHQLRVHLQAQGHVILGDTLYASAEDAARAPRLMLHASELHLPAIEDLGIAPQQFSCPPDF